MDVLIRKGEEKDLPAVMGLVHELALFEKAPDAVTNTLEKMKEDAFGAHPVMHFKVAELEGKIVGMAVYFVKYSTWKGRGLYLDDLYVQEKYRSLGIGRLLLMAYMEEAKNMKVHQLHWQVLDWNTPAVDFYKKMGASIEQEWWDCKINL